MANPANFNGRSSPDSKVKTAVGSDAAHRLTL
jgi:hypothetical protein